MSKFNKLQFSQISNKIKLFGICTSSISNIQQIKGTVGGVCHTNDIPYMQHLFSRGKTPAKEIRMVEILPQPTDAHNCFSLICQRKEMVRRL
jgi:hypothetical protein